MTTMTHAVSIKKLADSLRSSRPYIRRLAEDADIPVVTFRASNGKQAEGVAHEDVSTLVDLFHSSREASLMPVLEGVSQVQAQTVVYVVYLDPAYRRGRVKVGVSDGLAGRLQAFRIVCPEAVEAWSMPAPRACEGYALALAESMGTRVGVEVFDFEDDALEAYLSALSSAFALLQRTDA